MFTSTLDLAQVIQLAVAPVFLLAGIAGFLSVMSTRLGRIIDRSRIIDRRILKLDDETQKELSQTELIILMRRATIINRAIGLCTSSALLVCGLIICLFMAGVSEWPMIGLIAALFVLAMSLLMAALILFLKEIQLATRNLKIAREFPIDA